MESVISVSILALIISFASFLLIFYYISSERVWFKKYIWKFFRRANISASEFETFVYSLAEVLFKFSKGKIGSLIVIEKFHNLQKYINLGYAVESKFFPEFLYNIFFNKESSMHDGGVIIRGLKIKSVSSYFPISSDKDIPNEFGSRHRAAIGISSRTDAIAFLVSESTGKIMCSQGGGILELNKDNMTLLVNKLLELLGFYLE